MAKYPKKPTRPKRSSSIKTWENFDKRMKEWEAKKRAIDAAIKRKESLIKKYS